MHVTSHFLKVGDGRVAWPFSFAPTDPSVRISRTRLLLRSSESHRKGRPRVQSSGTRAGETLKPLIEPVPRESSLAPPSRCAKPGATDFIVTAVQRVPVARERVVPVVPAKYTAEPRVLPRQRRVPASSLFGTHGVQFAGDPSAVCPTLHDEASFSASRAVMRKAEEGKRLGPPVAARLSSFGGQPAEFDKALPDIPQDECDGH